MEVDKKVATPELMRPAQVHEVTEEIGRIERTMSGSHRGAIQDPGAMQKQVRNLKKNLDERAPKPYEAAEIDNQVQRADILREKISEGMLSQIEMRRNPVGAVDRHIKWERANKGRIKEYKHIMLRLNAGTDERDVANIEKFRPAGYVGGYSADAQIPGNFAMSPQAKANWPLGDPKCDTAAAQAARAEKAEADKQAMVARLTKARAAKAAKAAPAVGE